MGNIIDFVSHFNQRERKEKFREEMNASGWEITEELGSQGSDVCIYLMDTKESAVILFGIQFSELPNATQTPTVSWQNYILAWDVIADPEMPFDDVHKQSTISLTLPALSGVRGWETCRQQVLDAKDKKAPHLLVLIDREDAISPKELIIAYSESRVLNADSLQSIVNSYLKG